MRGFGTARINLAADCSKEDALAAAKAEAAVAALIVKTLSPGGIQFTDSITVPGRMRFYEDICEGFTLGNNKRYLFFRYEPVIAAFLTLKAQMTALPEGELYLEIANYGKMRIVLKDNVALCERTDRGCDIILPASKAAAYLFSPMKNCYDYPVSRSLLANAWFPLPLYCPRQDVN